MLDPIFDLLAGLLAWFYSLVPSYGFAIIALTTLVLIALSPLTYKSTKSMVAMRRVQPQVKRLQKKHKGDRETLNQEMMKLYQEHNVSPLSGCLPILIQSPVFIVMFRVLRGITRRSSEIGYHSGGAIARMSEAFARSDEVGDGSAIDVDFAIDGAARRNFNPEYLDPTSDLYQALINDNEMLWISIDLSRTPLEVLGDSISSSLPYMFMIALVAFLGWYQQQQIQGRMTGEVSSQQQMIMRIMPWMLPIFSFTMPAGLVLYFIVSALLRIMQQGYLTRSVYDNEELTTPIELDDDDEFDDDDDDEPENPLAALFGGGGAKKTGDGPAPSSRHGSRRPISTDGASKKRTRPPRGPDSGSADSGGGDKSARKAADKKSSDKKSSAGKSAAKKSGRGNGSEPAEKVSGWGRAKRSAPEKNQQPEKPVSRRVTPKGDSSPTNRRGKK